MSQNPNPFFLLLLKSAKHHLQFHAINQSKILTNQTDPHYHSNLAQFPPEKHTQIQI